MLLQERRTLADQDAGRIDQKRPAAGGTAGPAGPAGPSRPIDLDTAALADQVSFLYRCCNLKGLGMVSLEIDCAYLDDLAGQMSKSYKSPHDASTASFNCHMACRASAPRPLSS